MRVQSLMRHSYFRTGALGRTLPVPVLAVERAQPVQKPFALNPSNRQQQRIEGVANRVLWSHKWIREQTKKPPVFGRTQKRSTNLLDQDDDASPIAEVFAKTDSHDQTQQHSSLLEDMALAIQWANASTENGLAAALPDQPEIARILPTPNTSAQPSTAPQTADAQAASLLSGLKTLKAHAQLVPNPGLVEDITSRLPSYAANSYREQLASLSATRPLATAPAWL
jgi:hypothetical protein